MAEESQEHIHAVQHDCEAFLERQIFALPMAAGAGENAPSEAVVSQPTMRAKRSAAVPPKARGSTCMIAAQTCE